MGILAISPVTTIYEPVVTPEELRTFYGFKFPDSAIPYYTAMIKAAEKACARYMDMETLRYECSCSETFEVARGQRSVILRAQPLASVELVLDGTNPVDAKVDLLSSVVWYKDGFKGDEVTVEYTIGWNEEVPEDIKYAVAMTVQHMARTANSALMGKNSMSTDGGSETYEQAVVPVAVRSFLDHIRKGKVL